MKGWRRPIQSLKITGLSTIVAVAAAIVATAASGAAARANCLAHQPANMRFTPPDGLGLSWECTTAGPWVYNRGRDWYFITFKVTNHGARQANALKLQANLVDAFGDVLLTVPITESAQLDDGQSDGAVYAFHNPVPANSIDHVDFMVLAVSYADGSVWANPAAV